MSITIVGAVLALSTALPNYTVNEPHWRGSDRNVLVDPTPYPHGRSRLVSRDHHASPDFLVAGHRVLTRTPAHRNCNVEPGPAWYGLPADEYTRIGAWVGELAISINPYDAIPANSPGQLAKAQRIWLHESGLTGKARIVRRAQPRHTHDALDRHADAAPMFQIIQPEAPDKKRKRTRDLPLEVYRTSPDHIVITDGSDRQWNAAQRHLASNDR